MQILFKISSLGSGLGPEFILSDNFGLTNPYKFTKQQLLDGVIITVNNNATKVFVKSTGGWCNDCCIDESNFYILPTTTTSTSTTTSTTSTSTSTTSTTTQQYDPICLTGIIACPEQFNNTVCVPYASYQSEIDVALYNGQVVYKFNIDIGSFETLFILWNSTLNRWEARWNSVTGDLQAYLNIPYIAPTVPNPFGVGNLEWVDVFNTPVFEIYSTNSGSCCSCILIQYSITDSGYLDSNGTYLNCNNLEQEWVIAEATTGGVNETGSVSFCTSSPQSITFPLITDAGNPLISISDCFEEVVGNDVQNVCESYVNRMCFSMFYDFDEIESVVPSESQFPCPIINKTIFPGQQVNGKYTYTFEYDCGPAMSETCSPVGINIYKIQWSVINNRWELFLESTPTNILAYLTNPASSPIGELRNSWVWNDATTEIPIIVVTRPGGCLRNLCLKVDTEASGAIYTSLKTVYNTLDNTPGPSFTKPYYINDCDESGISPYKIRWNSISNIYELFLYDGGSNTYIKYAETTVSDLQTNYNLIWDVLPAYEALISFTTIIDSTGCPPA
jgi:hypothetical protein